VWVPVLPGPGDGSVDAVCVRVWWCLIIVFRLVMWEDAGLVAGGQCCDCLSVSDGRGDDTLQAVTVFVPVAVHPWRDLQCRFWPVSPGLPEIVAGVVEWCVWRVWDFCVLVVLVEM
jgi:hypothetical protein